MKTIYSSEIKLNYIQEYVHETLEKNIKLYMPSKLRYEQMLSKCEEIISDLKELIGSDDRFTEDSEDKDVTSSENHHKDVSHIEPINNDVHEVVNCVGNHPYFIHMNQFQERESINIPYEFKVSKSSIVDEPEVVETRNVVFLNTVKEVIDDDHVLDDKFIEIKNEESSDSDDVIVHMNEQDTDEKKDRVKTLANSCASVAEIHSKPLKANSHSPTVYHNQDNSSTYTLSSEDKSNILKQYKLSIGECFKSVSRDGKSNLKKLANILNEWINIRFSRIQGSKFTYNITSIPVWISDIIYVYGHYVKNGLSNQFEEKFKKWLAQVEDGNNNYPTPYWLMKIAKSNDAKYTSMASVILYHDLYYSGICNAGQCIVSIDEDSMLSRNLSVFNKNPENSDSVLRRYFKDCNSKGFVCIDDYSKDSGI